MIRTSDTNGFNMVQHLCFRLLPVQIVLAAIGAVNGVVSSLFASNFVGAVAMSAVGLYNPVRLFVAAVGTMLLGGSQIIIGKYMGKNQREEVQNIFSLNLIISVFLGAVVTALVLCAVAFGWSGLFTQDSQVKIYFEQYLLGAAAGILPQLLGQQISGFISLENQGRRTVVASIACIVATLGANYLFLVVLGWQAFGLAMASAVGMWVFFVVEILYYFTGRSELKLTFKNIRFSSSKEIAVTGLPGALSNVYMTIRSLAVNALIVSAAGGVGLSAFSTANAFLEVFWAIPAGMCAVSRMLIGVSTGEEDSKTLQNIMRVVFRRYLPIMMGIAAVIMVFAVPFTRLYYRDAAEAVFGMTVNGLRILPLCMPLSLICMHFVCYGQASEKQFLIHLLSVIDGVVAVVLFSVLLVPSMGVDGVYIANVLNGVATTVTVVLYAVVKNRGVPENMEQLMVIPKDFGAAEDDIIDITVNKMEQVVNISQQVQRFCLSKGIDTRRAFFAALAVEELAGNVVEHGFKKDNKDHSADIRVVCKGQDIILRIKDDCQPFNPQEYRNMINPQDSAKNIGIRIVFAMDSEVKYQNILGLNAITIKM